MIFDPALMTLDQWQRAITDAFSKPNGPTCQLVPRWAKDEAPKAVERAARDDTVI